MKKIIITIILCICVIIFQFLYFRIEINKQVKLAFKQGQTETLLNNSKNNLEEIEKNLESFEIKLKDYKILLEEIKGVSEHVYKKLEEFNNRLYSVDTAFKELYSIWSSTN